MNVVRTLAFALAVFVLARQPLAGADPKDAKEPAEVSYYRHVRPIFQQHCQGCHQPAKAQGEFIMTSYPELIKTREGKEPGIVPGKPEKSILVRQITSQDKKPPVMPKGKDPLSEREIQLIKKWIAQGATDDTPASTRAVIDEEHPPAYALPPVITAVAYSQDGSLLAVSGYHEVLLHKADGTGLVDRLVGLSDRIQSLAFSPDGKWLAVTGGDPGRFGEVQIWDLKKVKDKKDKKLKLSVPITHDTVYGASWSHDSTKVAFGCGDNTLRAIEASTGKQVFFQLSHSDWVLDTVFSIDSSHLVSVSRDRSMKLSDVEHQRFIDNITSITPGALKGGLMAVARHPKKDELLAGGSDGMPKIFQMHREKNRVIGDDFNLLRSFDALPGRIFAAKYSPDGRHVAVGSSFNGKGEIRVYPSGPGQPDDKVAALFALPPVGQQPLTSIVLLNDLHSAGTIVKFEGIRGAVYSLSYRPDGKAVASAGFDGVVWLNDPKTGKLIKEFVPIPLTGVAGK